MPNALKSWHWRTACSPWKDTTGQMGKVLQAVTLEGITLQESASFVCLVCISLNFHDESELPPWWKESAFAATFPTPPQQELLSKPMLLVAAIMKRSKSNQFPWADVCPCLWQTWNNTHYSMWQQSQSNHTATCFPPAWVCASGKWKQSYQIIK